MRMIGFPGGMSWESSIEYYRLANEIVRERLGGHASAACLMWSVDFAEIEAMQREDRWDDAGRALGEAATALVGAGAEVLVLCTNTMHKVADTIEASAGRPLLHIADVTARAVLAEGLDTVGLLATGYTMSQPFLRDRLESHGLTVLVPDEDDRAEVHRVVYDELVVGVVREESRRRYLEVMDSLAGRGAQGVILGCTEIELLVRPGDGTLPTFPTTRLHVEAAVDAALA